MPINDDDRVGDDDDDYDDDDDDDDWCLPNREPGRTLSSNQLLLKLHDSLTQPWKIIIMVMEIIYTQSH